MRVAREDEVEVEVWREGVVTRMYASAAFGAAQLTVFEQWCDPGVGAPPHLHAVEELLRIVEGEAEVTVGAERASLRAGASVVIPAGVVHGFFNTGSGTLRVLAVLASPIFEARYVEPPREVRRWGPVDAGPGNPG
jgi:mannose-6-phosphate isomerase-like protein (cupin superfamily)